MTKDTYAYRLAVKALKAVRVNEPVPVADTTVLCLNSDGTWSVCDNGEEVVCHTAGEVVEVIIDNLNAD